MFRENYSTVGFILSRKNYSEADRIITILTRDYGKITTLAKGVRKLKSRKRGSLEIFSKIKFSVSKNHGMGLITETQNIDSYHQIRNNLKKTSLAYYYCEVVNKILHEEDDSESIFYLLDKYLSNLKSSVGYKTQRINFVHEILSMLGFWSNNKLLSNPDGFLEAILEKKLNSLRVGKKMFENI